MEKVQLATAIRRLHLRLSPLSVDIAAKRPVSQRRESFGVRQARTFRALECLAASIKIRESTAELELGIIEDESNLPLQWRGWLRMLKRGLHIFVCLTVLALFSISAKAAEPNLEPPPVVIEIPRLEGGVTLDGSISEAVWSQALRVVIPRALLEPELPRADDVSGEVRLFWNDNGLYVAYKVDDRKLMLADTDDPLREYDAVRFWFDRLWIQVGLTKDGGSRFSVTNLGKYVPLIDTYPQAAASKISSGYTAEIFIPNSAANLYLGTDLKSGVQIRMAFGINNRYQENRSGHVTHSFPNRYGFNARDSFAVVTLK